MGDGLERVGEGTTSDGVHLPNQYPTTLAPGHVDNSHITSDVTGFCLNGAQNASKHEIPIENMIFTLYIPFYGYFILKNLVYKIFFSPRAPPGGGECIYGIVFPVAHCVLQSSCQTDGNACTL